MKVKEATAYHISKGKYEIGDTLSLPKRSYENSVKNDTEMFMENIRLEKYSEKLSRLSSLFVSPDIETAKKWRDKKCRFQPVTIYKLEINGELFTHKSKYFEECYSFLDEPQYRIQTECESKEEAANKYWDETVNFESNSDFLIEGLFVGEAKVIGIFELK